MYYPYKRTYYHFLPWAGRGVQTQADSITSEFIDIEKLEKEIAYCRREIEQKTKDIEEYIKGDWTDTEISEAKARFRAEGYKRTYTPEMLNDARNAYREASAGIIQQIKDAGKFAAVPGEAIKKTSQRLQHFLFLEGLLPIEPGEMEIAVKEFRDAAGCL